MDSIRSGKKRTAILGEAGTGTGFAIATRAHATWGEDVRIVGLDINPPELVTTSLLCDDFHQVAAESPATYRPILNEEIALAATLTGKWREAGVDILAPDPRMAELAHDKLLLASWLRENAVPCPQTFTPGVSVGPGPCS